MEWIILKDGLPKVGSCVWVTYDNGAVDCLNKTMEWNEKNLHLSFSLLGVKIIAWKYADVPKPYKGI